MEDPLPVLDRDAPRFVRREVLVDRRSDGTILLRSPVPLAPVEPHIPAYLRRWAGERPNQTWIAQRRGPERAWHHVSYGEAQRTVDALTQALLDLGGPSKGPLVILSGNSIEHALVTMAGMQARIPVAPISPAYSLLSRDFLKLKHLFSLLEPGYIFLQDGPPFENALANLPIEGCALIHVDRPPTGRQSHAYANLASVAVTSDVATSINAITPDTPGRILFTSGSTGMPKGAPNTHGMLCSNFAATIQMAPKRPSIDPPAILSWLPWNHTMGSSAHLLRMLCDGGAVYVDDGRPVPGQFDETLRNLKEIAVTNYSSVPSGYAALVTALEGDAELATKFFGRLETLSYGGATLSNDLYMRLQKLSIKYKGEPIILMTAWGATELGPNVTNLWWPAQRSGIVGLPLPGMEVKLIPCGDKFEMRVSGAGVMKGYWNQPELTAQSFDDEGYYITGDSGRFVDPDDPTEGLEFAGRIVEDFKLSTGTFVNTGPLRLAALAAASPVLQDAIVTGHDRDWVGLLAWINVAACRGLIGEVSASHEELVRHPVIVARIRDGLSAHGREAGGSSSRIARVLLMSEPPSIDGNELTDKGYINQRATRERRSDLIELLYAEDPTDDVILIPR